MRTVKVNLLSLVVALCSAIGIYAQEHTITGTVVDEFGDGLIGATILQDGKGIATTDMDSNFSVVVEQGAPLTFRYIGYTSQTWPAQNGMRVTLEEEKQMLESVEVVAYGVQKKVTVTGALSSLKSDDLVRTPVSSVNNVLAGQLSGVTTVQYSGEPGSDAASIFVRGQGTWNDSSPLVQVDGVERSMSDIDPEDIESITVLKDASATAVFGVRGANGVVLITTKRGAEGKAKIDVTTSFSLVQPTQLVKQAGSYDYGRFWNQMQLNDYAGDLGDYNPGFSDAVLQKFLDGSDPIRFPSVQWTDYVMKDNTLQSKHNVNISGGTNTLRYFVSTGLMTQGGLFNEFGSDREFGYQYNRFNYRANLDLDVTKTTKISFNLAGMTSNAHKPLTSGNSSDLIRTMYQATPFSSPGIIDGHYIMTTTDYTDGLRLPYTGTTGLAYYANQSGDIYQCGSIGTNINKLQADLQLEQKLDFITKGLALKVKGSYNNIFTVIKQGTGQIAIYQPVIQEDHTLEYRKLGQTRAISYTESTGKGRDWYIEAQLNYNRSFGSHTFTGLVLYNQSKEYYPAAYSDIPHGYVGLVGRVAYDWKNRYMAEVNIGYNGSENFHPDRRFGVFPAGSIGWSVSDEPFFEPLKSVIQFFKFRASCGLAGNDKYAGNTIRFMYTSDPYQVNINQSEVRGTGNKANAYNFGVDNSTYYMAAFEDYRNNPDITWEKALKQDYGVDLRLLDERLGITFDYYREHRTDIMLTDLTAPLLIGFSVPLSNLGIVDSQGWELSFKWNDKIGSDLRYWVNVNLSHNQNEVIEKKEEVYTNEFQYERGNRIGARYMYEFFRFYDDKTPELYEEKYGRPFPRQLVDLKDGDAVFVDIDGNGIIDGNDKTRKIGYTDDPEYVAGLNAGAAWKGLEVSMQWTGAWNVTRLLSDAFRQPFLSRTNNDDGGLLQYHVDHTWTPDNPSQNAEYPRASWSHGTNNNYQDCSLYEKDAKYLRLKTVMVAYTLKPDFLKRLGVNSMQIALSGYNLLTFSPYIWGDPETKASSSPSYPLQKTYTASLKLNF